MMTKLSDTARVILSRAAQHPDSLAEAPANLPAAARLAVIRSMLKHSLLEEVPAPRAHLALAWRQGEDGAQIALRITDVGLRAIGVDQATEPQEPQRDEAAQPSEVQRDLPTASQGDSLAASGPGAPCCDSGQVCEAAVVPPVAPGGPARYGGALREAAATVLAAWDDETGQRADLPSAIGALRVAMAKPAQASRGAAIPRKPREGTKQEAVLALLRRPEGASGPAIAEATGWAPHTVRGFLAGLAKKGLRIEVLDRVRQVGPGKDGAKGSYSIYRLVADRPTEAG